MQIFEDLPLPEHLHSAARIYWLMSEWCNYSCEYCGIPVFYRRSEKRKVNRHCFDFYTVDQWLEAFRKFPENDISMMITGGEPFLDWKNFKPLLAGLIEDGRFGIRVFTNLSWDADLYRGIDTSKVFLSTTFHPSQARFEDYHARVRRAQDAGFSFCQVGVILAPENLDEAEHALETLETEGYPVSGGVMMPAGRYIDRQERSLKERELIRRFSNPFGAWFNVTSPVTLGRACFHPAFSYRLSLDGMVRVACVGEDRNIFTEELPTTPRKAVACPNQHCENCTEMIRAIVDTPYGEPLTPYHPQQARDEVIAYRRSRKTGLSARDEWLLNDIDRRLSAMPLDVPDRTFVPTDVLTQPPEPPFGYIDKIEGSDLIEAFGKDRIYLSGWAASRRVNEPVSAVQLSVAGQPVAEVRRFYPRPEVVEVFGRPDLLESGWRTQFYLPLLEPGEYPIVASVITAGGVKGELPAFRLRIVG